MNAVLILGGTTEGYQLAQALAGRPGIRAITSLAGRTANPRLPEGEVRIGGFGGIDGLTGYLTAQSIRAVIDATHPFASRMGWNAAAACAAADIPLLRIERPAWRAGPGDLWQPVATWEQAVEAVDHAATRVLMTIGRQELAPFAALTKPFFLIRSVDPPDPMPPFANAQVLLARGPFDLDGELALMTGHAIDTVVCKNSGGTATDAKLSAARQLGIRVIMLDRPARPGTPTVADAAAAVQWIMNADRSATDHT